MDNEALKLNRNKKSENSSNSHKSDDSFAKKNLFKQISDDKRETSKQKENVNPNEEALGSKEEVIKTNQENMSVNQDKLTQNKEDIMINEEGMQVKENPTEIKVYFTQNKAEETIDREGLTLNEERLSTNMLGMITNDEIVINKGEKSVKKGFMMKYEENPIVNKAGKASNKQDTTTTNKEGMITNEEKPTTNKKEMTKMQEVCAIQQPGNNTNRPDLESNLEKLSLILERQKLFPQKMSRNPAAREIFSHSWRRYNNVVAFYDKLKRDTFVTVDTSTNTSFVTYKKQELREDGVTNVIDDPRVRRNLLTKLFRGLKEGHIRVFDILPEVREFMCCVPLHYGVYFIMCVEQIFFFLRAYTRVLNLAMPEFFPWLKYWLLICDLLLALFIMTSDVFLLVGIFLKPGYIFFWLDIHVLEVVAYVCLIISLVIADSGCVWEGCLIYCCYIICFVYFIITVNALRMSFQLPIVSHLNLKSQHVV